MVRHLMIAAALLGVLVIPASQVDAGGDRSVTVRGEIQRIDDATKTFLLVGSHDGHRFEVIVRANDDTIIVDHRHDERIRFSDLNVGDHVAVTGAPRHDGRHRWLQARLIVRFAH